MATDPGQPAAAALLAMLSANVNLVVIDGDVPVDQRPPYLVVYVAGGRGTGDNLNQASNQATMRAYLHAVGETAAAARIVAGQAADTILDQHLTVSEWSCGPIKRELDPTPPERDESTGALVMDSVAVYRWDMTAA